MVIWISAFGLTGLLVLFGAQSGCSQAEMSWFLEQTWTPGWAPGPVWTQKMLFSSRNELFLEQTWTPWTPVWAPGPVWSPKWLFSSRNELFLEQTWTPG